MGPLWSKKINLLLVKNNCLHASVRLNVLCKNGWADRDEIWHTYSHGPKA